MTHQPLKVALIGCGGLGTRHAKNVSSLDNVDLIAVCDAYLESAQKLAVDLPGNPIPFDDHQEMLAEQSPDAVLVVTPNHVHSSVTVDATQSGAHVFCEKPMALTVEECDAMIDAAEQSGVFLQIGYVRRFQNAYSEMKRLIDTGKIGKIGMAHTIRLGTGPPGGSEGWQLSKNTYGGLFSMHSHELDQLTWMGGEVEAVTAVMKYGDDPDNTVEESIFINLEFASGAIGSLSSSRIYPAGSYELGVAGTEGALKITSGAGTHLTFQQKGEKAERMEFERNNALLEEIPHFFDCIHTHTPPTCTGHDGRRTIAISLAAHEAAQTGSRVEVVQSTHR